MLNTDYSLLLRRCDYLYANPPWFITERFLQVVAAQALTVVVVLQSPIGKPWPFGACGVGRSKSACRTHSSFTRYRRRITVVPSRAELDPNIFDRVRADIESRKVPRSVVDKLAQRYNNAPARKRRRDGLCGHFNPKEQRLLQLWFSNYDFEAARGRRLPSPPTAVQVTTWIDSIASAPHSAFSFDKAKDYVTAVQSLYRYSHPNVAYTTSAVFKGWLAGLNTRPTMPSRTRATRYSEVPQWYSITRLWWALLATPRGWRQWFQPSLERKQLEQFRNWPFAPLDMDGRPYRRIRRRQPLRFCRPAIALGCDTAMAPFSVFREKRAQ